MLLHNGPRYPINIEKMDYYRSKSFHVPKLETLEWHLSNKVGCVFPIVIGSEFRIQQYRDDDHREDAPYFKII